MLEILKTVRQFRKRSMLMDSFLILQKIQGFCSSLFWKKFLDVLLLIEGLFQDLRNRFIPFHRFRPESSNLVELLYLNSYTIYLSKDDTEKARCSSIEFFTIMSYIVCLLINSVPFSSTYTLAPCPMQYQLIMKPGSVII